MPQYVTTIYWSTSDKDLDSVQAGALAAERMEQFDSSVTGVVINDVKTEEVEEERS